MIQKLQRCPKCNSIDVAINTDDENTHIIICMDCKGGAVLVSALTVLRLTDEGISLATFIKKQIDLARKNFQ